MIDIVLAALLDALIDTLKLIPFLFVTYLAMEALEHFASEKTEELIQKAGHFGPFIGAVLGVVPQCGFSTAASTLYAGRVITLGTLIAVFLSTSDEMLPIFIAEQVPMELMLEVIGIKIVVAIVVGLGVDLVLHLVHREGDGHEHIHELCEQEHCDCNDGVVVSALKHTIQVTLFIFVVALLLGLIIEGAGEDVLADVMRDNPAFSVIIASLVGLIPNCAASVAITELYLEGALEAGAMMGGLLVSAGVGLLVLFRTNRPMKDNLLIALFIFVVGVVFGGIFTVAGLTL